MRMSSGALISEGACVAQFVTGTAVLGGAEVSWQTIGAYRLDLDRRLVGEVWLVPLDSALFDRLWSG